MSISLDVSLYIRDHNEELNLSAAERGVLFTLAFRIGSNPFTWISQKNLADELLMHETNLRIHVNKLVDKKLLVIEKDPKDKRKNRYRPDEKLINYHQKRRYAQIDCSENYRAKSLGNLNNTERNHSVNTERNHPVINCTISSETPVVIDKNDCANSPKEKEQIKIKSKDKIYCANDFAHAQINDSIFEQFWNIYPRKKDKNRARDIWRRKRYDEIATLIMNDVKNRISNDDAWREEKFIPHPSTYLRNERWNDDLTLRKPTSKKESGAERALRLCLN